MVRNIVLLVTFMFASVVSKADNDFGYTKTPDTSSSSSSPVCAFGGTFDVSSLGAATYTIPIDVPVGLGGMRPNISLTYSSQSSFGLAGLGFNLSGLSSITRGPKSVWQDGVSSGISYKDDDDAFYLDGERLIRDDNGYCLVSNHKVKAYKKKMRVYVNKTEYDTYKKIQEFEAGVEQRVKAETRYYIRDWGWEVVSEDGTVSTYQCVLLNLMDDNSNGSYTSSGKNVHRYSWVLTRVEDKLGNYMTVDYDVDKANWFAYPKTISYGKNSTIPNFSTVSNTVNFVYENLNASGESVGEHHPFSFDNRIGDITRRIKSIVCKTNNEVYCSYELSYNQISESGLGTSFSRLVSVRKVNGEGENTKPITFRWGNESTFSMNSELRNTETRKDIQLYDFAHDKFRDLRGHRNFFSADINGDGYSDIIEFDAVGCKENGRVNEYTYLFIHASHKRWDGSIVYYRLKEFILPASYDFEVKGGGFYEKTHKSYTVSFADFNNDGIQDLFIPYYGAIREGSYMKGYFIYGARKTQDLECLIRDCIDFQHSAEIKGSNLGDKLKNFFLPTADKYDLPTSPIYATFDIDNDGYGNYLILESVKTGEYGYKCYVGSPNDHGTFDKHVCFLNLPNVPKCMYPSDYNKDGMIDIMVVYDGGYSIFYNKGLNNVFFAQEASVSGNTLGYHDIIREGDFDGDGFADYFYVDDFKWHIAYGNGDGKFDIRLAYESEVSDQSKIDGDDGKFAVLIYDANSDGKSDIFVSKPQFDKKGNNPITYTYLLRSNGKRGAIGFYCDYNQQKEFEGDFASYWILGDFYAEGKNELLHYSESPYVWFTPIHEMLGGCFVVHRYVTGKDYRKLTGITDAMDNTIDITYGSLSDGDLYTCSGNATSPVVEQIVPLDLVSMVKISNGALASNTTEYKYTGLKIHTQGRGILGFDEITTQNEVLDTKVINRVESFDTEYYTPNKVTTESYVLSADKLYKTSIVDYQIDAVGDKGCYFYHPVHKVETDIYGHTAEVDYEYDAENRVLCKELAYSDGDKESMYKCMEYFYPNEKTYNGVLKPSEIWSEQKHADDKLDCLTITKFEYDSNGLVIKKIENYKTDKALTTLTEYDFAGNVKRMEVSGADVKTKVLNYVYDSSNRFKTMTYTDYENTPNSIAEMGYDLWGHCMYSVAYNEDYDENVDSTYYEYDGWGSLIKTRDTFGNVSVVSKGWGTSQEKKYYVLSQGTHTPWVKTWYDSMGREVETESVGAKDVAISSSVLYDDKGKVVKRNSSEGKKMIAETIKYDEFGRVVLDEFSTGQSTTTEYGNRSITVTSANKSVKKTFDAWGNPKIVKDGSNRINYTYCSWGEPVKIKTGENVIEITYDESTGYKTSMKTSDRGTVSYKYNSLGECIYTKDGWNVYKTTKYDEQGRVTEKKVGAMVIKYVYGVDELNANKLVSKSLYSGSNLTSRTSYEYDEHGRVVSEEKYIAKTGNRYKTSYEYYPTGELHFVHYPHGITDVEYKYDCYGNKSEVYVDGKRAWQLAKYLGNVSEIKALGDKGVNVMSYSDNSGRLTRKLITGSGTNIQLLYSYDSASGNMMHRCGVMDNTEEFKYDEFDRLTQYVSLDGIVQKVDYSESGNIIDKSDMGVYSYENANRPNQLTSMSNEMGVYPYGTRDIMYNVWNRVSRIRDDVSMYKMEFEYDEDGIRNWAKLTKQNVLIREIEYTGDLEHIKTNNTDDYFVYLGDNLLCHYNKNVSECLYICTDHLGSVLRIVDEQGESKFEAIYDAWGNQKVIKNSIGFIRGYTGQEEMPEFGLVNLNARLYDPMLGRFLSPDDYLQMPENSQNYNRYAYCLNNPLKYNDPSGNCFDLISIGLAMWQAGLTSWANGDTFCDGVVDYAKDYAKNLAFNLVGQGMAYGIGEIFGHSMGSVWNEAFRAGAHGLSNGLLYVMQGKDFGTGFAAGSLSSIAGSGAEAAFNNENVTIAVMAASGALATLITDGSGNSMLSGAMIGFNVGSLNHCGGDWYEDEDGEIVYKNTIDGRQYEGLKFRGHTYSKDNKYYSFFGNIYDVNCKSQNFIDYSVTKELDRVLVDYYIYHKESTCDFRDLAKRILKGSNKSYIRLKFNYGVGKDEYGHGWITLWKNSKNNMGRIGSHCLDILDGNQGLGSYDSMTKLPTGHFVIIDRGVGTYENLRLSIPQGNSMVRILKPDFSTYKRRFYSGLMNR